MSSKRYDAFEELAIVALDALIVVLKSQKRFRQILRKKVKSVESN